jgi:hypothetical protein
MNSHVVCIIRAVAVFSLAERSKTANEMARHVFEYGCCDALSARNGQRKHCEGVGLTDNTEPASVINVTEYLALQTTV